MKTWLVKTYGSRAKVETNLINKGRYSYILDSGRGGRQLGPEHDLGEWKNAEDYKRAINKIRPTWGNKLWRFSQIKRGDRLVMLSGAMVMAIGIAKSHSRFVKTQELSKAKKLPLWGHELDVDWQEHEGPKGLGRKLIFKGKHSMFIHGVIYDISEDNQLLQFIGVKNGSMGMAQRKQGELDEIHPEDYEYAGVAREGQIKSHTRSERKRAPGITKEAKDLARSLGGGDIECEGCDIKIKKVLGYEVIDAHHLAPLAEYRDEGQETYLGDLAMLCPTCHRLTHRVLADGLADDIGAVNLVRAKHGLRPKKHNTLHKFKKVLATET